MSTFWRCLYSSLPHQTISQCAHDGDNQQPDPLLFCEPVLDSDLFGSGEVTPFRRTVLIAVDGSIGRPVRKDATLSVFTQAVKRARLGPGRIGDTFVEPAARAESSQFDAEISDDSVRLTPCNVEWAPP
jgi:hypothetical protein